MPPSCLAQPAAGQQFITENHAEPVGGDAGGDLRAVRAGCGALAEYLNQIVDHRSRQGLRYQLGFLLAVVVAATACAGHDEVAAQAQWAADALPWVLRALGAKPDPLTGTVTAPSEATLRRALAKVNTADLQRLSTQWTQALGASASDGHSARLPAVAIDGKSVRGAAAGGHARPHLLSAATHDGAIVIAQRQIPNKGSEIGELKALVAELDLAGKVVTVDALHTQRTTAQHLVSVKGADYIMTIKANQPRLLAAAQQATSGPATDFLEHTEHDRGHGRTEQRILRTVTVTPQTGIDFPHPAQAFRVIRYIGDLHGQRRTKEVAYCLTSLTPARADGPDLGELLRGHWGAIENRTHWVRDTTFNEDASTPRTGTAPQAMSIIRNTIIAAFRLTGWTNLKQARRHFAHGIHRCVDLITRSLKTVKLQT
ncbi:MAG: ISAs1 family transposase [Pseudonocardiaceae bacterium]